MVRHNGRLLSSTGYSTQGLSSFMLHEFVQPSEDCALALTLGETPVCGRTHLLPSGDCQPSESGRNSPSSSAKADDPVIPGINIRSPKPQRTGYPAFLFGPGRLASASRGAR